MEVKLWTEQKEDVIYVRHVTDNDHLVRIEFVNENGDRIATIFSVSRGLHQGCKDALKECCYDTSFANWDGHGRYFGLKEN